MKERDGGGGGGVRGTGGDRRGGVKAVSVGIVDRDGEGGGLEGVLHGVSEGVNIPYIEDPFKHHLWISPLSEGISIHTGGSVSQSFRLLS